MNGYQIHLQMQTEGYKRVYEAPLEYSRKRALDWCWDQLQPKERDRVITLKALRR